MMRNIPGGLSFAITLLYSTCCITHKLNRADCGYQVHKTDREISHLLYVNGLKLLVTDEDGLENEIKNMKAFGKNINKSLVLKIVQTFDNNITYSTIVYQLLILCRSEVNLVVFRQ